MQIKWYVDGETQRMFASLDDFEVATIPNPRYDQLQADTFNEDPGADQGNNPSRLHQTKIRVKREHYANGSPFLLGEQGARAIREVMSKMNAAELSAGYIEFVLGDE